MKMPNLSSLEKVKEDELFERVQTLPEKYRIVLAVVFSLFLIILVVVVLSMLNYLVKQESFRLR